MMNLIDTHAHLDELEDLEGACRRARAAGVTMIRYGTAAPRFVENHGGLRVTVVDALLPDRMLECSTGRLVAPARIGPPES